MAAIQVIQETDNFIKQILDQLEPRIADIIKKVKHEKPEELLTRKETASFLKINLSTLHRWSESGKIKRYCLENRVYYKRSEVESSLTQV